MCQTFIFGTYTDLMAFDGIAFKENDYANYQVYLLSSDKLWVFARTLYLWAIDEIVGLAFLASVLNNEKTLT